MMIPEKGIPGSALSGKESEWDDRNRVGSRPGWIGAIVVISGTAGFDL
jgi:hypothetical protein